MGAGLICSLLLLVPSSQKLSRVRVDRIVRSATCNKRVSQVVVGVPTVGARRQCDFEAGKIAVDGLRILMGEVQNFGNGQAGF